MRKISAGVALVIRKKELPQYAGCCHKKELKIRRKKLEVIYIETRNKRLTVFGNNWCK